MEGEVEKPPANAPFATAETPAACEALEPGGGLGRKEIDPNRNYMIRLVKVKFNCPMMYYVTWPAAGSAVLAMPGWSFCKLKKKPRSYPPREFSGLHYFWQRAD